MDLTFLNRKIFSSWNKQYGRQKLQTMIVKVKFHTVKIELATRCWLSYQYSVVSINTQRRVKTQAACKWCFFERRQGHVAFFAYLTHKWFSAKRKIALTWIAKVKPAALVSCWSCKKKIAQISVTHLAKAFFHFVSGSTCEPPSSPLCFRIIVNDTIYCEWKANTTESSVTYELVFEWVGLHTHGRVCSCSDSDASWSLYS